MLKHRVLHKKEKQNKTRLYNVTYIIIPTAKDYHKSGFTCA